MATLSERLALIIDFNGTAAVKGLEGVAKKSEDAGSKLTKVGDQLTKLGAAGLAASGIAAGGLAKLATRASDLNEVTSKTNVIFGDASDEVKAFAKTAAQSLGQSETSALTAASTFGVFGKAAGKSGKELAAFSTDLVKLSGDLSSFSNTSPEQAIEAIGAALRGEAEPIRQYGVLLDDATLKQRALAMGLIESTKGSLEPAVKVQAAYAEILAQTTDAQGDFARTADGAANQQRILKAELENLATGIGTGLLPAFTAIVSGAAQVVGALNSISPEAKTMLGTLAVGGVGVVGALSGISLVTGQLLKMRDRFTEVTAAGRTLSTAGKAAGALGLAVGAAAIAFALLKANSDDTVVSMKDFGKAADTEVVAKLKNVKTAFDEATLAQKKNVEVYESGQGTKALVDGIEIYKDLKAAQDDLAQVTKDFNKILKENPEVAQRFIDAATKAGYETGEWQRKLDAHVKAVAENRNALAEYNKAIEEAGTTTKRSADESGRAAKEVALLGFETGKAAESAEDLEAAEKALKEEGEKAKDAADNLADARKILAENTRDAYKAAMESVDPILRERAATRDLADASKDLKDKLKEAADAKFKDIEKNTAVVAAQDGLITKLAEVAGAYVLANGKSLESSQGAQMYVDKLSELRDQYGKQLGPAISIFDELIARIKATIREQDRLNQSAAGYAPGYGSGPIKARADGGPVRAGEPYLIGEEGPEIMVPSQSGVVLPNDAFGSGTGGSPLGGGAVVFNVSTISPRDFVDGLAAHIRTNGNGDLRRLLGIS